MKPTKAEQVLWLRLKGRQLEGCKFRRQHPFGDFIVDFVCLERAVAVELDGSQHFDSAVNDAKRTRFLEMSGFVVLRFWNSDVLENMEGVAEVVCRHLREQAKPILTQPSP